MAESGIASVLFVGHFDILDELSAVTQRHGAQLHLAFGERQRAPWAGTAKNSPAAERLIEGAIVASSFDTVADQLDINETWLILSMGSPFIFRRRHIERVAGHIVNSHGAPLPEHAGGGGMSWRIMSGDRRGTVLLHQVSEGIDEGEILYREDFEFPADLRLPGEFADYVRPLIVAAAIGLVDEVLGTGSLPATTPQTGRPTYFPRLSTQVHGAIDWRWRFDEIERFVLAFAAPNPGAFTTCRGERVAVIDARTSDWTTRPPHPFMSGLVIAADGDGWIVAAPDGYLRVVLDPAAAITPRLGDRLFTPSFLLERAWSTRVEFLPGGMREQDRA